MPDKKKVGFCVYHFAHHGVGRTIDETDDMVKTRKELKYYISGKPNNDISNIVCHSDKRTAIKKYNDLKKKTRNKRRLRNKSLKKKSLKKKSLKKKRRLRNKSLKNKSLKK